MNSQDICPGLIHVASRNLRADPVRLIDARLGVEHGNTLCGNNLSVVYQMPRDIAERAVQLALAEIDAEGPGNHN